MALLQEKNKEQVRKVLAELENTVTLINFSQDFECQFCRETRGLMEEIAELSDKIILQTFDFQKDKEVADRYGIDKIPATVIEGDKDYGIRFYGIPTGYELSTLLDDIVHVSKGDSELSGPTRDALSGLQQDVHLQVFVTPTCPYCPRAVMVAHRMAIESDRITADMVEAGEFPHLAQKYRVMGVPRTIINETESIEGAATEDVVLQKILAVAGK